jgi:hypothetical protein
MSATQVSAYQLSAYVDDGSSAVQLFANNPIIPRPLTEIHPQIKRLKKQLITTTIISDFPEL